MPDPPIYPKRDHPGKMIARTADNPRPRDRRHVHRRKASYAELCCKTNFSFLRGASHPEQLAQRAADLGYTALAITDRNTLAGVVRMHCATKACDLKLLVGAEITPVDAPSLCLYATDRAAYGRLCRIITAGRLREKKGSCAISLADIVAQHEGLIAVVHARDENGYHGRSAIGGLRDIFSDRLYLAASVHGGSDDDRRLAELNALSRSVHIPLVATNDVHYHDADRSFLQDILTCIREHCTMEHAGTRLFPNAERHLKPVAEMEHLFCDYPEAIARTIEIADRCTFTLDELRYEYPEALCPPHHSPDEYLAELTWSGARQRYPTGVPTKVRDLIVHELRLIRELSYEPYFLTVWDIVRFARSRDILCQGRGSAANSAVCYCLGITSVDPDRINLLFERFLSAERNEPPDIDVDFEHERREEVFQYIYNKYGREHAGLVAEVITYRPRSAIRDVGKALGFSLDKISRLAKRHEWWDQSAVSDAFLRESGFAPHDRTLRMLRKLVGQIKGFPRHLSQHVGGFVITRGPLCEMVPIENGAMPDRTFIEWDKDDIDALGILKIDCLALGMLTAIRKCVTFINHSRVPIVDCRLQRCPTHPIDNQQSKIDNPTVDLELHNVPPEDPAVYAMICHADTVGVFQIESRAQMSMLPRLKPRCFYDLVIEVAIVRPGPIQGGMVHPYLRRRAGEDQITYPSNAIKEVLQRTLGVPLFQEQAMKLAVVAADFTPGEADRLRRAMGAWGRRGDIGDFRTKLLEGMKRNGLPEEFAERCYQQICGFGEYGFPESHAASFALLVYVSAWLKRYHPAAFCAALLNSQPMGFYQPAQLVRDAKEHGVMVLPVDVNHSGYDCRLEIKRPSQNCVAPASCRCNHGLQARTTLANGMDSDRPSKKCGTGFQPVCLPAISPVYSEYCPSAPAGSRCHTKTSFLQQDAKENRPKTFGNQSPHKRSNGENREPIDDPTQWGAKGPAVRLGMRLVRGISRKQVETIERAQREQPFSSVIDLARRSGASRVTLSRLAAADAMGSMGLNRREALWRVLALGDESPLIAGHEIDEPDTSLPTPTRRDTVLTDYQTVGLSLTAHPIELVRDELAAAGVQPAEALKHARHGQWMRVGGLVLVRQRPGTAKGIVFCTLEDETGIANLIIRSEVYERYRREARGAVALVAEGRVERQGEVIHINTRRLTDMSDALIDMPSVSRNFH